jgi:hypothetical protein
MLKIDAKIMAYHLQMYFIDKYQHFRLEFLGNTYTGDLHPMLLSMVQMHFEFTYTNMLKKK